MGTISMATESEISIEGGVNTTSTSTSTTSHEIEDLYIDGDSNDTEEEEVAVYDPLQSFTSSLSSTIYDYVEENGRRYHRFKEGTYVLPNDETEQNRLDLQHQLCLLTTQGKLHFAPIEKILEEKKKEMEEGDIVHHILDIGTGTGNWAIDFANLFPEVEVLGTDLSPIQPELSPKNCHFEVDDAEDTWIFPQKFSYIHGRMLCFCFNSPITVFASAFNALQPGGYLELQDIVLPWRSIDGSLQNTALEKWLGLLEKGANRLGRSIGNVVRYKSMLEEAGFVDVVEREFRMPIGTWAKGERWKLIGHWCREDALQGIEGWSLKLLTKGLGMDVKEVDDLLRDVRRDLLSKELHSYGPFYIVYGRKPA